MKKFGYATVMQVPKIEKIVINTGLGDIKDNQKSMQMVENELKIITGQKPIYRKATKSVANFKLREGMPVGLKVTLRGKRMYDFYDKLVSIALPRVRDFRGVSDKAFDGRGNYSVGLKEQLIFPEIVYDQRHGRLHRNDGKDGRRSERTFEGARNALQEVRRRVWQRSQ